MKEATACAWVETYDYSRFTAVWSYAASTSRNEWLLAFSDPSKFVINRRSFVNFAVSPMSGRQKVTRLKILTSTATRSSGEM